MIMFAATMLWADKQKLLNIKESLEFQLNQQLDLYRNTELSENVEVVLFNKCVALEEQLNEVKKQIKEIDDKFQIVIKYILHSFRFTIK